MIISVENGAVSVFIAFFIPPIQREIHQQSWSRLCPMIVPPTVMDAIP
jgi:hypothetical protein